jgi:phospholipid/cholesterol/gamma-HCH transport system substrate-binding protein
MRAGNMSSSVGLNDTYSVSARFDNIGGLKPRAAVRSAGVVVGRVASVTLDPDSYEAVVRIDLDTRFRFPKDSSAKILTAGLLGEQYVGLEAGGDSAYLNAGDRITLTQSAVVLENIIGQMLYSRAAEGDRK